MIGTLINDALSVKAGTLMAGAGLDTGKAAPDDVPQALLAATPSAMFWRFSRVGLQGFGGVLPLIQREVVERARWIDDAEFAEVMGLAAALPGPNVCNLAVIFGWQQAGVQGAVAALSGLVLGPAILLLIVATLLQGLSDLAVVRGALDGMSAVAAGLIFASALKMLLALKAQRSLLVFGLFAFAAVAFLHWSLVPVLLVSGALSVAAAWWQIVRKTTR